MVNDLVEHHDMPSVALQSGDGQWNHACVYLKLHVEWLQGIAARFRFLSRQFL